MTDGFGKPRLRNRSDDPIKRARHALTLCREEARKQRGILWGKFFEGEASDEEMARHSLIASRQDAHADQIEKMLRELGHEV